MSLGEVFVIVAVCRMNFATAPGLDWRYGYPLVLVVAAVIWLILYRSFYRIGWR